MLKTAIKPKWIAALVAALIVAAVFVLLSQWQFSRSLEKDVAPPSVTEKTQPLLATLAPGELLLGKNEGQLVTVSGHFDTSKQVIVDSRLQHGKQGFWVVTAFVVDGAPKLEGVAATAQTVIPIARGWISDPAQALPAPSGTLEIEGRLLNSEGPVLKKNMPEGHVSALSSAELTNRWNVNTYAAFVIAHTETLNGQEVGASAVNSHLTEITVTATDQNKINWLNIFYSIEWVVFAGFAVFLWWRLVADDFRREQDEIYDVEHHDEDDDDDDDHDPDDDPEIDPDIDSGDHARAAAAQQGDSIK